MNKSRYTPAKIALQFLNNARSGQTIVFNVLKLIDKILVCVIRTFKLSIDI